MGKVHPLFSATFDPEATRATGAGVRERMAIAQRIGERLRCGLSRSVSRNLMARKILELARCGERNPTRLRAAALEAVIGSVHPARSRQ